MLENLSQLLNPLAMSQFFLNVCMLFNVTRFRWHFVSIVYSVSELWSVWQWLAWSQFTRSKPERCSIWTNVNTSSYVTNNSLVALLGNKRTLCGGKHFIYCVKMYCQYFNTFNRFSASVITEINYITLMNPWQWCETGIETILLDFLRH